MNTCSAHEHLSLPISLEVEAAPDHSAFRVTIALSGIDLVIQAIESDLGDALRAAADRCAARLDACGYGISSATVLAALEEPCDEPEPAALLAYN